MRKYLNSFNIPIIILLIFLSSFYFILPLGILSINKIELVFWGVDYSKININQIIQFIILNFTILIIFFLTILFILNKHKEDLIEKETIEKKTIIVLNILLCISLVFVLIDISKILLFYSDNFESVYNLFKKQQLRSFLYYEFLNKRTTHFKLAVIISFTLILMKQYKLPYVTLFLIFFFNVITLARFEIFLIVWLVIIINFNFFLKNKIKLLIFSSFIGSYLIINYIFRFSEFHFTNSQYLGEPRALLLSLVIFMNNFLEIIKSESFGIYMFLSDNLNFILNSLFYQNFETVPYWESNIFKNKFSNIGTSYLIVYAPSYILIFGIISYLINTKLLNFKIFYVCLIYILILSVRANPIHELFFCLKYFLLICFMRYILILKKKFFKQA